MIKEVDLVSYLPPFMQEYKALAQTLEAENPEFALLWEAAGRVRKNAFVATADDVILGKPFSTLTSAAKSFLIIAP